MNCNFHHNEYVGYVTNICKNNYENDFCIILANTKIERNYIHYNYIYCNINDRRKILISILLLLIGNIKATNLYLDLISPLFILYFSKY